MHHSTHRPEGSASGRSATPLMPPESAAIAAATDAGQGCKPGQQGFCDRIRAVVHGAVAALGQAPSSHLPVPSSLQFPEVPGDAPVERRPGVIQSPCHQDWATQLSCHGLWSWPWIPREHPAQTQKEVLSQRQVSSAMKIPFA